MNADRQRKTRTALAVAGLSLIWAVPATAEMHVAATGKAYKGGEGLQVQIVPVEPRSLKQVLIKIVNAEGEWDQQVRLFTIRKTRDRIEYVTRHPDTQASWVTLITEQKAGKDVHSLFLAERDQPVTIVYDEALSKAVNTAEVLKEYEAQVAKDKAQE